MIKEDKKEIILNHAERLFSENGYDGASTRAIAKDAGVNMAMLNYYFGSKEGLYKAVFVRKFSGFHESLLQIISCPFSSWEKITRYVDIYADRIVKHNCFHRLMTYELSIQQRSDMTNIIVDHLLKNINIGKSIIEEGIKEGVFRKVDPEMTIATIFGSMYYVVHLKNITSALLDVDMHNPEVVINDIKPRIKKHLAALLEAHLKV
ncbi:TetR/AcrR family transcriptional regulator [Arcticibacter eurypsychrophilus]|uniref:TetR/AcrR family transcriptional regulator n=1 Tax=Arcticibacter eurypsychrophilus TaxID=1434752 RepID=UPI00084CED9B|nr:TetR/AcrR family transcriptional regulator [Arcticibacter eurypsychrophilus]